MRSHKTRTRSKRDRSIPRSLQRRVSTKSSISHLTFFHSIISCPIPRHCCSGVKCSHRIYFAREPSAIIPTPPTTTVYPVPNLNIDQTKLAVDCAWERCVCVFFSWFFFERSTKHPSTLFFFIAPCKEVVVDFVKWEWDGISRPEAETTWLILRKSWEVDWVLVVAFFCRQ